MPTSCTERVENAAPTQSRCLRVRRVRTDMSRVFQQEEFPPKSNFTANKIAPKRRVDPESFPLARKKGPRGTPQKSKQKRTITSPPACMRPEMIANASRKCRPRTRTRSDSRRHRRRKQTFEVILATGTSVRDVRSPSRSRSVFFGRYTSVDTEIRAGAYY